MSAAVARPATLGVDPAGILLETWLEHARIGIPIVPEHTPDSASPTGCDCRNPKCTKPGKHPRTTNGALDATTNQATLERWAKTWPQANTGTCLEMAGLVIIGPDSPGAAAEFARRGLPPTPTARSGGGEGHLHYYYRRRPCCPTGRLCKPGEYDLLAKGNVILPPSRHASGEQYTWLVPIESLDQIPYAPTWLCAELHPLAEREPRTPYRGGGDDGPPVVLDDHGQQVWWGELPKRKPDGTVDRSGTLLKIGRALYDAGATRRVIEPELAERDETLGYRKFTDRRDRDKRYAKIVDELEKNGRTPRLVIDPPALNGHANGQANVAAAEPPETGHDGAEGCLPCTAKDAEIARLQRALLEREDTIESQQHILRAQQADLGEFQAERAAILEVIANPDLSGNQKGIFLVAAIKTHAQLDLRADVAQRHPERAVDTEVAHEPLGAIAASAGVSDDTVGKVFRQMKNTEAAPFEYRVTRELRHNDDGSEEWISIPTLKPRPGRLTETLSAIANYHPVRSKHVGARETACRAHPGADVIITTTKHCSVCREELDRRSTPTPGLKPQDAVSEDSPPAVESPGLFTPQDAVSDGAATLQLTGFEAESALAVHMNGHTYPNGEAVTATAPPLKLKREPWRCPGVKANGRPCRALEWVLRPDGVKQCLGCGTEATEGGGL